ncbi:cytochrome c oxidase assembly protein [Sphingomonas sp.]|uniref:cytochrome c oxidase assembly protein n=1 Tax=Sphingomonas sp. TaxID=28214 RepID=UPI0031E21E77
MDQAAIWIPYCGVAPVPGELLARWNLDPLLLAALALATIAGLRFGEVERRPLLIAMALLALLFVSPFCALTSALFSARAVHHLALTAVVAPLLAAALPVRRVPGGPVPWTGLHAVTFWLWHAPAAYEAALSNHALYWLMQASLLLSALALWRAVRAAPPTSGIAGLLATMVQMGLLGALLTFAGTPLYAPHALGPLAWGATPLEDQQLAGLIMWAPGAGLYLAAALALLARWFARERDAAAAA